MKLFAVISLIILSQVCAATELDGAKFSEKVNVGRATLTLNGVGVRTATLFKVKVYAAGLYVAQPSKDAAALLDAQWPVQLHMEFFRNVDSKDMENAWGKTFKENCEAKCESLQERMDKLQKFMPTIKKRDRMTYTFQEEGVEITRNGNKIVNIAGADFSRFLLSTWLGKKPPTEDLKKGLLGIAP